MNRLRMVTLGVLAITACATWAAAEDRYKENSYAYQVGLRQGLWDAHHNRTSNPYTNHWKRGRDRHDYEAGYLRGFREARAYRANDNRWRDRDDDGWRNRYLENRGRYAASGGGYGAYLDAARRAGYEDGLNDGANDRRTGHSYRPSEHGNYKRADRGYSSSYGNKDEYKQAYRQGYQEGYQRGYNGG